MVGIVNPQVLPPILGTQFGTFIFKWFKTPIAVLTPEIIPRIIPLISAITPLIGTFAIPTSASNTPLKIFFTPSHARFQSPVNTPTIKSITPPRAFSIPATTSLTESNNSRNTLPIILRALAICGATLPIMNLTNGTNTFSHRTFSASTIFPISSIALCIASPTGPAMISLILAASWSNTGTM